MTLKPLPYPSLCRQSGLREVIIIPLATVSQTIYVHMISSHLHPSQIGRVFFASHNPAREKEVQQSSRIGEELFFFFWANAVLCFPAKEMSGSVLSHAGWRASAGLLRRAVLFMLLTGACFAHWGRSGRKLRKCHDVHGHTS